MCIYIYTINVYVYKYIYIYIWSLNWNPVHWQISMAPSTVEWLICLALVSLASCASFAPTGLCCRLGLRRQLAVKRQYIMFAGCWFGTFCIFHSMWDNPSHWPICFRGVAQPPSSLFSMGPQQWPAQHAHLRCISDLLRRERRPVLSSGGFSLESCTWIPSCNLLHSYGKIHHF